VKSVLLAINGKAKAAIQNSKVGVSAHTHPKVKTAIFGVGVIPVTVVGITVTGGSMNHRLRGLVDGVIVKLGKHAQNLYESGRLA
jgi:hypothetical protein